MTCDICHDDQFPGEIFGLYLVCTRCLPAMPEHVREWLRVNDDVKPVKPDKLKCPICGDWLTSIDHLAPYHWETCWCAKCQKYPHQPESVHRAPTSRISDPATARPGRKKRKRMPKKPGSTSEFQKSNAEELAREQLKAESGGGVGSSVGLGDALRILINIGTEYERLCDVMLTMPERKSELKAADRFMDALENLRDELLKRKSSNAKLSD